ncbi:MAG TPA: peptidoglycan DD-metalloendopeptidase family protein [Acetobacteraceae bacterium]|nr:peptidoglycan DD-metalloendopeptidase family protein [Acetobacteraceae bacterium]
MAPHAGWSAPGTLSAAQRALAAAQHEEAAHQAQAAAAAAAARQDAQRRALLVEREVAAAAAARDTEAASESQAAALSAIDQQIAAARDETARDGAALAPLLPLMERLAINPAATILAAPESPIDSVNGILILQGLTKEIATRAAALKESQARLAILQTQAAGAKRDLDQKLALQMQAESVIDSQISVAERSSRAAAGQAAREHDAAEGAATEAANLRSLIIELQQDAARHAAELAAERAADRAARAAHLATARPGAPAANAPASGKPVAGGPVAGTLVRAFGAPTLAGPAIGVTYNAAPAGRVVAPCAGKIVFGKPFSGYGLLLILDCGGGYDFVMSGMEKLNVRVGQMVANGQPVGQMPGLGHSGDAGATPPQLYVELRQDGTPVDPAKLIGDHG